MSGLLCSEAYSNATTSYYLKNGQSIVAPSLVSPVSVVSPDGTQTGTIAQNNNGNMVIYPPPSKGLFLGNGSVDFSSPDGTKAGSISENNAGTMIVASGVGDLTLYPGTGAVYILSADSNSSVELAMSNGGPFTIEPAGNTVVIGNNGASAGAVLQVNGSAGVGRVYDSLYNTPAMTTLTSVTSYSGVETPLIYSNNSFALTPGNYMLQMFAETVVPAPETRLRLFLVEPTPSSQVVNYGAISISYDSATIAEFSVSTGIFTVPISGNYSLTLISSGANWTATQWGIQLVKIA